LNELNWGVSPSHSYLQEDIVDVPHQPQNGMYSIPHKPGLGVEVNESKLDRFKA